MGNGFGNSKGTAGKRISAIGPAIPCFCLPSLSSLRIINEFPWENTNSFFTFSSIAHAQLVQKKTPFATGRPGRGSRRAAG
jgi:hypothetical protein